MPKWIEKWDVPRSSGDGFWVVSMDNDGLYGCSCPVWKFKRQECKHIEAVKNGEYDTGGDKGLDACPGNVGEVTIKGDVVLYPLAPIGVAITTDLRATIVYDMKRAGVKPELIKEYKDKMLGPKNSISAIIVHVEKHGRLVYSKFIEGQGWVEPVYVPAAQQEKYKIAEKKLCQIGASITP